MSTDSSSTEVAAVAMAVGSLIVVLFVVSVSFAVQKRRQRLGSRRSTNARISGGLISLCSGEASCVGTPTDFMNNLASWDRSHSIDDIVSKRKRAAWTLELFGNRGIKEASLEKDNHLPSAIDIQP